MDYKLASSTWDEKELAAIDNVVKSGMFSMGENVKEFENDFSKFFGVKYSIMVNSGSSANLLAIASLFFRKKNPLKRGDEVIVPTVSWSTTYTPLQQYGLKLKFVDVNLKTLNYDLDKLKTAVSTETRLIVCVNLLGNPNDFDSIKELCSNHEIDIFEDNCESMGAKYKSQFTGTIGKVGSFSTFFSHHISTMEGGGNNNK
ncbi:aminotransferase class V-fold PLP-dependent enzyme [Flavobacteriaceae bacterium]|nr:aminotransferase class V-fold PLP-dependent enzyme [Flavobacteriaceae bacterium]